MKYLTLILLLTAVSSVSATTDPFQYTDTPHSAVKQIVKFNKNNKPHSKFFGREKMKTKRGIAFHKKSSRG
jgi:hypothetical protein